MSWLLDLWDSRDQGSERCSSTDDRTNDCVNGSDTS